MLNEFRTQQIRWDKATRKIYDTVQANASDSNGRKLHVQITNDGIVEDLTGATLSLYWESRVGKNGLDAFEAVDVSKGEFELFYTTGMLSNVGRLNAALVLVDSTGKTVSDWFTISNIRGINEDAVESSNEFTALTEALVKINDLEASYAPRLNEVTAQLAQKAKRTEVFLKENGININDLDEPTRQAFLEAQNIDVNYVLGPGNVKPENTSFLIFNREVNEITQAKTVNSISELESSNENAILKNHRNGFNGSLGSNSDYDVLKLFVSPGDVIRSKTINRGFKEDSPSTLYYVTFFNASGDFISMHQLVFPGASNSTVLDIRENGLTAPENTDFCYINTFVRYYYDVDKLADNGKTAEVITINKNRQFTDYDGTNILDDYDPVEENYTFDKKVSLENYEQRLNEIENALENFSGFQSTGVKKKLYSFGVLSDVHLRDTSTGANDVTNSHDDYQRALSFYEDLDIDLICLPGDVLYNNYPADGSTPTDIAEQNFINELTLFRDYNATFDGEVHTCTGNHDATPLGYNNAPGGLGYVMSSSIYGDGTKTAENAWEEYVGHPINYSFERDGDVFVFHSMYFWNYVNFCRREDTDWLESVLESNKDKRVFLFCHVPVPETFDGPTETRSLTVLPEGQGGRSRDFLERIVNQYPNVIWFSGHSHYDLRLQKDFENPNVFKNEEKPEQMTMVHCSSGTYVREYDVATGTDTNMNNSSEGYVVDVYEKSIVVKGVDFIQNKYITIAEYLINTSH